MEDETSLTPPSIALTSIEFSTRKCWSHRYRGTGNKRAMMALYRSTVLYVKQGLFVKHACPPYGLSGVVAAIV
ncbi:hypothetical protein DPMN_064624 [Dreissena polymorpha]|uniref:Uncharacterized protein n=1 Tax=Dreissena polymorpha TaxID=45954 RepID=A0A9D4CCJ5_DREPO|nr:hypothetical protein DPMN_064624 [Dreissena polymorpha]